MFHYSKAILQVGGRIIANYLVYFKRWAKHIEKYPREKRFNRVRNLCRAISRALSVDINVFGLENLPLDKNFCIVSNHMSAFDPLPFMINYEKPLTFVGKKELMDAPLLPKVMTVLEAEYLDRDDLRQSLKVMLRVEDDLKNNQKSWMIFPEGTRIHDQMLPVGEFHHGTFRPATKAGVPIIPAAIYGSFRVLKAKPQFKKYPVSISFLKPLMPKDYAHMHTSDIALKVHDDIQREITYHLRPLDHKIMSEAKDKKYRFNMIV